MPYVVGRCRYDETPRGEIIGDHVGFIKLLFDRADKRLLGVHVIGEQATEVVHIGLVAMTQNGTADLFQAICFNYPTLGELYKSATQDALFKLRDPSDVKAYGDNRSRLLSWERTAVEALPLLWRVAPRPTRRRSLQGSAFPGGAWERA